ncbi:MAG: arsenate reductase ArsC [Candidatus Thorarchaeota archaeon]
MLFLCTGNSARSQIAEAILKLLGSNEFDVVSAGTEIASQVNPFAIEVLKERSIDTKGLHPKGVDIFKDQLFDIIITVCDDAKESCPFFPGEALMHHWSLEDPAAFVGSQEEILIKFRETRDEIERRIRDQLF